MNTLPLSEWRSAYAAALFENECGHWQAKIKEANAEIEERVLTLSQHDAIERISLEAAQKALAAMECGPVSKKLSKSKPEVKSAVNVSVAAIDPLTKNSYPTVGSHVRVSLRSSQIVEAEVVAIFSAAGRKPILLSFENKFARVDPQQIERA